MTKRIVFITSRFPYPLEKGDKLRAYFQIKELSKHFDIHLISITEKKITKEFAELEPYCKSIHVFKLSFSQKWFGVFLAFLGSKPLQIGYFYNHNTNRKINKIIKDLSPNHIYCQLIRVSEYVKNYHQCSKTIDYMDALSKGMERRINSEPWYLKWIYRTENERLQRYERSIFEYFEYRTIISQQDKQCIFHPEQIKIKVIPNGVSPHFFDEIKVEKQYDLVFVGNLSYVPNIEAVHFISTHILPTLPKLSLLIAGADPVNQVTSLSSALVKVSGWVADIRTSYASGRLFVAPMFIGSGLQNKLLEAMALGIPCITTSLANNALKAEPNKQILIANNASEYTELISNILTDNELYTRISVEGRKFIEKKFQWHETTIELIEILNN